jgi:hypothetical protein
MMSCVAHLINVNLENIFPVLYFVTEGNCLEMQIRNQIVKMDLMKTWMLAVLEITLLIMMSCVAHHLIINVNLENIFPVLYNVMEVQYI